MIEKINKTVGLHKCVNYVLDKKHKPILLASTCAGENPREIAHEMEALRRLRPALGRACLHVSLSFPRADNPLLTDAKLAKMASEYALRMGFATAAWIVVRHHDRAHAHIHLVACRVLPDRSVVSDGWDFRRGENVVRDLERKYHLTQVPDSRLCDRRAPSHAEIEMGSRSDRLMLQGILSAAAAGGPTMSEFVERIQARGVTMAVHPKVTGGIAGVRFRRLTSSLWFKGYAVGKAFSWPGLQRRLGVNYEPGRDLAKLIRAGARAQNRALQPEKVRGELARFVAIKQRQAHSLSEGISEALKTIRQLIRASASSADVSRAIDRLVSGINHYLRHPGAQALVARPLIEQMARLTNNPPPAYASAVQIIAKQMPWWSWRLKIIQPDSAQPKPAPAPETRPSSSPSFLPEGF